MPDDHSKVVPLLPIPNRTVKRLSANDSADSRVKVGHRQAITASIPPSLHSRLGVLLWAAVFIDRAILNVGPLARYLNTRRKDRRGMVLKLRALKTLASLKSLSKHRRSAWPQGTDRVARFQASTFTRDCQFNTLRVGVICRASWARRPNCCATHSAAAKYPSGDYDAG